MKKIIIGGLLVALSGVLVVGAINRAAAHSGETSSNQHGQTTQDVVAERGGRNGSGGNQGSVEAVGEANTTSSQLFHLVSMREWHTEHNQIKDWPQTSRLGGKSNER